VINLRISRRRALAFSLQFFATTCLPAVSQAQSDTTEVRTSEAAALQNQGYDERAAELERQQVEARIQWIQQNDPQLWRLLVQWENTTKDYNKLSGKHRRFVYDSVFQVEKRSDGEFYYEAPDKGRIDIKAAEIPEGEQSQRLSPQGKPYALKSDKPEEIWICDGKQIAQANDYGAGKYYSVFQIPKMKQGVNIMDGPLPFLFGLPARQAVQRYDFKLLPNTNEQFVWLDVLPKREEDQRNWKQAQVILDRKTFLPFAVKLIDPAGTTETVYRFSELQVNQNAIIRFFGGGLNWFNIPKVMKDKGYTLVQNNQNGAPEGPAVGPAEQPGRTTLQPRNETRPQPGPQPGDTPVQKVAMPNYVNAKYEFVKKAFTERGYKPEFYSAGPAPSPEYVHKIAGQKPDTGSLLQPGQKVIFYVYEEVKSAGKP